MENKTEIMHHVFKMLEMFLLHEHIKLISRGVFPCSFAYADAVPLTV